MSWSSGLKPSNSNPSESDLREAKRQKLQADRLKRIKDRADRQNQLQAAINAQREADQALQDLLNIDPDIETEIQSLPCSHRNLSETTNYCKNLEAKDQLHEMVTSAIKNRGTFKQMESDKTMD